MCSEQLLQTLCIVLRSVSVPQKLTVPLQIKEVPCHFHRVNLFDSSVAFSSFCPRLSSLSTSIAILITWCFLAVPAHHRCFNTCFQTCWLEIKTLYYCTIHSAVQYTKAPLVQDAHTSRYAKHMN